MRLLSIVLILTIILTFCIAYADETQIIPDESESSNESETEQSSDDPTEIPTVLTPPEPTDLPSNITSVTVQAVSPVTPSNTTGLKSALLSVLGNYDPVIVEYQYQSSNGYYSYLREIQPDYVWIWSCILLIIVIYCLFRLLGGVFGAKRN